MKSQFSKMLDTVKSCRLCGGKYTSEQIQLIDRTETGTVAHATCGQCCHSTLVFMGKTNHGLGFLGLSTDLSEADAKRFKTGEPVSENQLLAAHRLLEKDSRSLVTHLYYQSFLP